MMCTYFKQVGPFFVNFLFGVLDGLDGFIPGLDSVELPNGPKTAVYFPGAYDAGTEANDELYTSVVDPCGAIGPVAVDPDGANDRPATSDVVMAHPGFAGAGSGAESGAGYC